MHYSTHWNYHWFCSVINSFSGWANGKQPSEIGRLCFLDSVVDIFLRFIGIPFDDKGND